MTRESSRRAIADFAMAAIYGGQDAARVLHEITGGRASPDALFHAAEAVAAIDEPERSRGFFRAVQKRIEGTKP